MFTQVKYCFGEKNGEKTLKTNFEKAKILLSVFLFGFAIKSAFRIKCPTRKFLRLRNTLPA